MSSSAFIPILRKAGEGKSVFHAFPARDENLQTSLRLRREVPCLSLLSAAEGAEITQSPRRS